MEMCYDGTLVLPSSYAVMDEEEMTYVEGGSAKTFTNNLKGIWNMGVAAQRALRMGGFNYAALLACAKASYS